MAETGPLGVVYHAHVRTHTHVCTPACAHCVPSIVDKVPGNERVQQLIRLGMSGRVVDELPFQTSTAVAQISARKVRMRFF